MSWTVEALDGVVEAELAALPKDMLARFRWIADLIATHGLERMREPYVKHLEDALWEMRLKGRDGISRALYVTARERRIIIVRVFVKKTPRTPRREIELALARAAKIR